MGWVLRVRMRLSVVPKVSVGLFRAFSILLVILLVRCHGDRYGIWNEPSREGRPDDGRQSPVFTDTIGRDIVFGRVCHVDEPAEEVHRHGSGKDPPRGES